LKNTTFSYYSSRILIDVAITGEQLMGFHPQHWKIKVGFWPLNQFDKSGFILCWNEEMAMAMAMAVAMAMAMAMAVAMAMAKLSSVSSY
jgi:hypothetical protein